MTTKSTTSRMRVPAGLGVAGRSLWAQLTTGPNKELVLEMAEPTLLEMACHQRDNIDLLEQSLAKDGLYIPGSAGQLRLNPVVAELRQGRLALGKLLESISWPDTANVPRSAQSIRNQKAANSRWSREKADARG